jgi:hypothetical protein
MKALLSVFWAYGCETSLNLEEEYKLQVFKTKLPVKYIELWIILL